MNDAPGWASPGSSGDREPSGEGRDQQHRPSDGAADTARPADDTPQPPVPPPPTGWTAQQPPPAGSGWSTPGGQPRPPAGEQGQSQYGQPGQYGQYNQYGQYGHHGHGQPGGWGGAWQYAQAAKPGVIPLRPLGLTEILDGAISTMRAHWRPVLGIALGVAVLVQLISTITTRLWLSDNSALASLQEGRALSTEETVDFVTTTLGTSSISGLTSLIGTVIATAMLTMIISRAVLGRPVTIGEVWQDARPQLPRLLGLTLLVTALLVGVLIVSVLPGLLLAGAVGAAGLILVVLGFLGGLVLMIWLAIRFTLSPAALMLERAGVLTAMRRSAKLVRGSWWRIFGIQLLAALIVGVLGFIISLPATLIATAVGGGSGGLLGGPPAELSWTYLIIVGIGSVLTSTITLPFTAGVTALLYIDARIRREGLDLELARAAGPQDGAPGRPGTAAPGY
ncbi:hypothetical protein JJV70_14355 [Streptomyces sp. JJ66]|uniref:hypothetical protein n=1 Tax=Streptomyces sp. JJ66 TaxID=2803843 RepID=UPI001C56B137|nr:hypothetical protein [Streptomyces sp. JJ66]MBW1603260.1 hypothetical protein [Streptomyces sp. JJ66]